MKTLARTTIVFALLSLGCSSPLAGDAEPGGLAAGLRRHYKLSTSTLGANGYPRLIPGTVLTVRQRGIVSFGEEEASYVELCSSDFQSGSIREPQSPICNRLAPPGKRVLKVSETVCITALKVDERGDTVAMSLTTCKRNGASHRSGVYHALLRFRFPRGSLAVSSVADVEAVIGQALSAGDAAPPAENAKPDPHPSGVAKGQSTDQVVAILGPPRSIADLGAKLIYYYPSCRIVFVNGKVSEIQSI